MQPSQGVEITDLGHVEVVVHIRLCAIQRLMQLSEGRVGVPGCLLCATATLRLCGGLLERMLLSEPVNSCQDAMQWQALPVQSGHSLPRACTWRSTVMCENRSGCEELDLNMALKSSSLMHTPPPPEQQHLPTGTLGGPWGMGPSSSDVIRRTTFACAARPAQAPL